MSSKSYQQQQLEATPGRALQLLRGIATNQKIRFAMASAGYGEKEQAEGWELLLAATGYAAPSAPPDADVAAREAIAELDDWDESGFRRIHAALERFHPEQDAFLFAGIEASRGPSAVVGVAQLLDRLDQLSNGSEADRAAMATLEQRGIDDALRAHLRQVVAVAQAARPMDLPTNQATTDELQQALEALSGWYRDWSETARAMIRRRDQLILLGLAKRRSSRAEPEEIEDPASSPSAEAGQVSVTAPEIASTPTNGMPKMAAASNGASGAGAGTTGNVVPVAASGAIGNLATASANVASPAIAANNVTGNEAGSAVGIAR